jgi:hypothetical protein
LARPQRFDITKTSDFRTIDIAWLRRKGACKVGWTGRVSWKNRDGQETASVNYRLEPAGLRLTYSYRNRYTGGAPIDVNELVPIVTTPMNFGGCRHWFRCPSCGRRCRIIYGGTHFRCRGCVGATYESQYVGPMMRLIDARWKLRYWLHERGGEDPMLWGGLDDGLQPRPPRMHRKTYARVQAREERLAACWSGAALAWIDRTDARRLVSNKIIQGLF